MDDRATPTVGLSAPPDRPNRTPPRASAAGAPRKRVTDLSARGEPFVWMLGGSLVVGILMILGFLLMVAWNGLSTFWPLPVAVVTQVDGPVTAGPATRSEVFRVGPERLGRLSPEVREQIEENDGFASRTLYRIGNFELYNEDFRWIADFETRAIEYPEDMYYVERREWGIFVGCIASLDLDGRVIDGTSLDRNVLQRAISDAQARFREIRRIEQSEIGHNSRQIEELRLDLRRAALRYGIESERYKAIQAEIEPQVAKLEERHSELASRAAALKQADARYTITLREIGGREKVEPVSIVVRMYPANAVTFMEKVGIYVSRWIEFLTAEPREANTEGGVLPAIFGTFIMTLLMVIVVAPFGVITALYLREYAKQGRLVSIVRVSVNNLAGVPSIVYGVFGLGFFAYILGGSIDQLFYPERLPSPTFGTGGILWASLTLALLTVPVVIVATEEALAAVPRSTREGSLACGASKWQTIRRVVLPRAMPGIMTGLILAMARGAGEVAPLMLVGVVKLAPALPVDGYFPFIHLERSFMHLGFHIFDVGFQSRNSEAGKPMVFVTTLLLIGLIVIMNIWAILVRNRLKKKLAGSQF